MGFSLSLFCCFVGGPSVVVAVCPEDVKKCIEPRKSIQTKRRERKKEISTTPFKMRDDAF